MAERADSEEMKLVERLREACNGHPHAKIAWPHRVLHEAADTIASLVAERDEARGIVRDIHWMAVRYADGRRSYAPGMCNDALRKAYDGGWLTYEAFRQHDLDPQYAREGDKPEYRTVEARALSAEASLAQMREALEYAAMGLGRIHDSLLGNGPKQASGEMTAHFLERARAALQSEGAKP